MVVYTYCVMRALTHLTECSALIAVAVFKAEGDIQNVVLCFRITCACIAWDLATFTVASFVLFTKFLNMLEAALDANKANNNYAYHESLSDIIKRFRFARGIFLVFTPLTMVELILNATILPLFWYLILLDLISVVSGCLAVLFAITNRSRRKRIMRFCFGCIPGVLPLLLSSDNNNNNSAMALVSHQQRSPKTSRKTDLEIPVLGGSRQPAGENTVSGAAPPSPSRLLSPAAEQFLLDPTSNQRVMDDGDDGNDR